METEKNSTVGQEALYKRRERNNTAKDIALHYVKQTQIFVSN